MTSYCDLNAMKNDGVNHPYFTARLNNWLSEATRSEATNKSEATGKSEAPRKGGNCNASTKPVSDLSGNDCLTDAEIACYSSFTLRSSREKLDKSLADVYQPENSTTATFDSNYQTTMLTGVVWAALGTTVLYYVFTKI
jgi:hypothetical protein